MLGKKTAMKRKGGEPAGKRRKVVKDEGEPGAEESPAESSADAEESPEDEEESPEDEEESPDQSEE